jgi:hypothetical protein
MSGVGGSPTFVVSRGDKKSIQLIIALLQAFEPTIEAQRPKEVLIYSGVLAELDRRV